VVPGAGRPIIERITNPYRQQHQEGDRHPERHPFDEADIDSRDLIDLIHGD